MRMYTPHVNRNVWLCIISTADEATCYTEYMRTAIFLGLFLLVCGASNASAQQRLLFPVDLHPGVKNEVAVIVLQKFLKAERFYDGPLLGIYDTSTAKAVQKFQEKNTIRPNDGIFKGATRSRANSIIQQQLDDYATATGTNVATNGELVVKKVLPTTANPVPKKLVVAKKNQNCFVATNMIKHGETKTMYRYPIPAQNGSCLSEKRRCENGFLDGDPGYRYTTCKGTSQTSVEVKNKAPMEEKRTTCITGKDASGSDVQLCAVLPVNNKCSTTEHPCAFTGPDGKKACFAKVGGSCPRVPSSK